MSSISTAVATNANTKEEITMEIPTFVRVYKDGTIERLQDSPFVPPTLEDPTTGVSSKDVIISDNPPISARLYLPKLIQFESQNDRFPILVYFHGGGFFFESAFSQLHHKYMSMFVSIAHVVVISVEYRLAPETPLPAAYEDCWEALKWVATKTEPWTKNHGDFNRVFLGGDSAGANIVHNIALRAGAEVLPNGVKLLGALVSQPYFFGSKPIGSEQVVGHEQSAAFLVWDFVYPSAPGGLDNPMINPLVVGGHNLGGLGCSKLLVCTAEKDQLRDRAVSYYKAVKESGWHGEVELFQMEGEDHVFHIHNPETEKSKIMLQRFADFLLQ
ncbi:2-hydroxyisoflavanone dehydratase-like [Abrus precatorius]|uniref:2-hydroxyisoflavanone dehydratase-like n=1 Tax=Abrus precatorius TaxID=3816 RepID=A0A8B8LWJ0_ABRPR|nr:2-hydroxyisoflavanone dehydratase-like [Abrus precatorius]